MTPTIRDLRLRFVNEMNRSLTMGEDWAQIEQELDRAQQGERELDRVERRDAIDEETGELTEYDFVADDLNFDANRERGGK